MGKAAALPYRIFMFTGIVEEAGVIEKITPTKKSIEMTVRANVCWRGVKKIGRASCRERVSSPV